MDNNKNEDNKYLLYLYTGIALLNAVTYTKINYKKEKDIEIKETNFENHFELNDNWNSLLNKTNKRKDKSAEKSVKKEWEKSLAQYINLLRNFYSHSEANKIYKENKKKLEEFEKNKKWLFNEIIDGMNQNLFKEFKKYEKRILFTCLFLNKSEIKDLINQININYKNTFTNTLLILEKSRWHRKYGFVQTNVYTRESIYDKVLNYFKNFNDVKNHKNAFIKIGISLLNYKYKNDNIRFKRLKKHEKYLIHFSIIIKDNKILNEGVINFESLKYLLLVNEEKALKKIIYPIKKEEVHDIPKQSLLENNNFESFKHRYSPDSQIGIRHLLKTLNRVNWLVANSDEDDSFKLHQTWFELLFQTLNLENIQFLNYDEKLKDMLNKMLNINTKDNNLTTDQLKNSIKEYILLKIDSKDKFEALIHKNPLGTSETIGEIQGTKYIKWKLIMKAKEFSNYEYDRELFDFQNLKNKSPNERKELNIKKLFLAPIAMFFINHFKDVTKRTTRTIDETFCKKQNIDIFNDKQLTYIFKDKIPSDKNEIKIIDKETHKEFKLTNFKPEDMHYIINSKLFIAFKDLFQINEITKMTWKQILNEISKYTTKEIDIIKKVFPWDTRKNDHYKYRNYIAHRSLNLFRDYEEFKKIAY